MHINNQVGTDRHTNVHIKFAGTLTNTISKTVHCSLADGSFHSKNTMRNDKQFSLNFQLIKHNEHNKHLMDNKQGTIKSRLSCRRSKF